MTTYDVIVIGAGIEGSSTAYNLIKRGQNVLLLEQFPLPHSRGSSHGHSRITRYVYEEDFYVRMMKDAFPLWTELEKEAGVQFFVNCGTIDIRVKGSAGEGAVVNSLSKYNCPHEVLSPEEVTRRFPAISVPAGCTGLWDPSGGLLRADKCLNAFQTVFKRLGGILHDGEAVTSLIPGEVNTVVTSKNTYTAPCVVIATGPWTSRFTKDLNLNLPLKPERISVLYWRADPNHLKECSPASLPCILDSRGNPGDEMGPRGTAALFHIYALPIDEYPGLVKVALHTGPDIHPDHRDVEDSAWIEKRVSGYITELLPLLDHTKPAISEACIYTNTPDANPFIDQHPKYKNVIICAGFSGHGFKLAPAVGKAVSELVLGDTPSYNMLPFKLNRFSPNSKL